MPSSDRDRRDSGATIRVCHVIHSLQAGGAEESIVAVASAARAADLEVDVLSLLPVAGSRVARRLAGAGVRVSTLGLRSRWDARALRDATAVLRESSPDLVHTHLKHADIVGSFASRRIGVPMVSTLHVVEDRPRGVARAKRLLGNRARRAGATVTIAVSDAQRSWYLRDLHGDPARVITVRNGVADPPSLPEAARLELRRAIGVAPGELMVSTVALMRPGKGHDDVLTLAERMGLDAGVRFVLVGDGDLREGLERRAEGTSNTSAPVVFTGFREDVPAILAASDLVLHTAHADALPTALIHTLAAGRPTLAYAVGGVPEIVSPQAGLLVAPRDLDALEAGFRRLAGSSTTRKQLGSGARARYEEEFTLAMWVARLRAVYSRVLETSSNGRRPARRG